MLILVNMADVEKAKIADIVVATLVQSACSAMAIMASAASKDVPDSSATPDAAGMAFIFDEVMAKIVIVDGTVDMASDTVLDITYAAGMVKTVGSV